ncbi:MAG: CotH kinase family protein [Bacteroidales bacterium]|nr:CotH kinase family protein [Bacteroidales bacterium]
MKRALLIITICLVYLAGHAQWLSSSNLPIVIITTDIDPNTNNHYAIQDDPKVGATMKILFVNDSTINYLDNQNDSAYLNYNGRIGIELRGSTSQGHNKKPYGLETRMADDSTNLNVPLLGLPAENDWILNPMNDERSYLRDALSYILMAELGHYAPRTRYCEVIVNGDYRGLYYLTEKIKIDDNRVDLWAMDSTDNTFPKVSGGYIIKADKTTGGDVAAWTTPAHDYWEDVNYIFHDPKPEEISAEQGTYIQQYFDTITQTIAAHNQDVGTGFPAYIDIPAFVDYMIMGEFTSNVDIYQKSTFFHKDRMGKLRAGPVWDFNLTFGNDLGNVVGRSGYDVLQFDNGDNTGSDFWHQLYEDDMFYCYLSNRWNELTEEGAPLDINHINHLIDSLVNRIENAMGREIWRWLRFYDYDAHLLEMKEWIGNRFDWLDSAFNDTLSCAVETLPSLVISKINYHPPIMMGHSSDELEFIGITNNSSDTVDVTGIYFKNLGLTYQFPANSVINPHQEIFLASNPQVFQDCYHKTAYGKFYRHLDNKSEALVLADAWGNIIDEVTYADTPPWPTAADGFGEFLILIDLDYDNSLAESWMSASEFVGIEEHDRQTALSVTPNPTSDITSIHSDKLIKRITLADISGRIIKIQDIFSDKCDLNMSTFPSGIYILQVVTEDGNTLTRKIVKK